jgi:hypothetical protein
MKHKKAPKPNTASRSILTHQPTRILSFVPDSNRFATKITPDLKFCILPKAFLFLAYG